jgi:hypothetical protein
MKRLFSMLLLAAAICLFAACTPQSSPRQLAKTFWTDVQQEKYSEAVSLYYNIDEFISEDGKEALVALMKVDAALYGKITKVKVLSVDKSDEPDRAVVTVELTTENRPQPRVETMDVVKSNGKWYIDFNI